MFKVGDKVQVRTEAHQVTGTVVNVDGELCCVDSQFDQDGRLSGDPETPHVREWFHSQDLFDVNSAA